MRYYHKWLLSASPKKTVLRIDDQRISVLNSKPARYSLPTKLTPLKAACQYVNLSHMSQSRTRRGAERSPGPGRPLLTYRPYLHARSKND
jgi:hypothetical protein